MAWTLDRIPFVFEQLCAKTVAIWGFNKQQAGRFAKRKCFFHCPFRVGDMFDNRAKSNQVKRFFLIRGREDITMENINAVLLFRKKHGIFGNFQAVDPAAAMLL